MKWPQFGIKRFFLAIVLLGLVIFGVLRYWDRESVREIARDKNTSTIRVRSQKNGSVASSMSLVEEFCGISRERNCEYFINLKEWSAPDGSRIYIIGFTNKKDADLKTEFGSQFDYNHESGTPRGYFSVSELDAVMGMGNRP